MIFQKIYSLCVLLLGLQATLAMKPADFAKVMKKTGNGQQLSVGLQGSVGNLHAQRTIPAGPVNDEKMIATVNEGNHGWKAGNSPRFEGHELADVSKLCGTVLKGEPHYFELPDKDYSALADVEVPTSFDSRDQWKSCTNIGHIRDQSSCGSCWAFGSTEAFEDRYCIANNVSKLFSVEDTTGCCSWFSCGLSQGCNGGQPSGAWSWFTRKGVVTGGDYEDIGKETSCKPYTLKPCAHHVTSPKYGPCPAQEYPTPKCSKACSEAKYSVQYSADKAKAKESFAVNGVDNIMKEIMTNGPVTGAFSVYSDFPTYKTGVYKKTPGASFLGGHAIKIIGWGVEDGVEYWIVVNSWNETWGDGGTFKIKKGTDECGIESQISAGTF